MIEAHGLHGVMIPNGLELLERLSEALPHWRFVYYFLHRAVSAYMARPFSCINSFVWVDQMRLDETRSDLRERPVRVQKN